MLQHAAYCPILHTRLAETKALLQLPAASKDRLFPILVARPWANARQLNRTWEKITEAFGERQFGLDLDRSKYHVETKGPAGSQFDELFDPAEGFAKYYAIVGAISSAIPVIQLVGRDQGNFSKQIQNVSSLDRGAILLVRHGVTHDPAAIIRSLVGEVADLAVVIDVGWSRDLLGRELWASDLIRAVIDADPETEIVVSGSSFPDAFANIQGRGEIPVVERSLHASLTRRFNEATIVYGDWGSTRPPSTDSVPMRNIPRIDLPANAEWVSFRQIKDSEEGYAEIAKRVMKDPAWPHGLKIWGTYVISTTAESLPGSIKGAAAAAAARINIHLHRQTNFGLPKLTSDAEEPFTDD